jgi:hypothetical protein
MKILIIGGYGVFGGRIVELLENEPRLNLLIGGRSVEKARAYIVSRTQARALLEPAALDRDGDIGKHLSVFRPALVIDASGPFQAYGKAPYRVIEACIAHGANYLDLADGSDFVAGVGAFDERARSAGLFILSGVSSFPVLTVAVVRRLSRDMTAVTSITGGIAPSPFAGVGENVIRAIASYAGQPISRKRGGVESTGHPFTEQRRYTIAPPGRLPLRSTMFSLVDVPDLRALQALWPEAKDIWMGAGPVPEILHRLLAALAWLVRWRLLPSLSPLAPLMHFATNRLRWGEHRGGMFVEVSGQDSAGAPLKRSWHLLAEGDDGPLIPSMAIEAVVRNLLAGRRPQPGARACLQDLELEDYEALFARRSIHTGVRDDPAPGAPLYARLLGDAWRDLPAPIRAMHDVARTETIEGRGTVSRGGGPLAVAAATAIGFPPSADDIKVVVRFDVEHERETWTRTFGATNFKSVQFEGRGRSACLLCERFGPLTFAMALVVEQSRLSLILRRWSAFGAPLPLWLGPRERAYESAEDGRFHFHVDISHPLAGPIVKYEGWLGRAIVATAAA